MQKYPIKTTAIDAEFIIKKQDMSSNLQRSRKTHNIPHFKRLYRQQTHIQAAPVLTTADWWTLKNAGRAEALIYVFNLFIPQWGRSTGAKVPCVASLW